MLKPCTWSKRVAAQFIGLLLMSPCIAIALAGASAEEPPIELTIGSAFRAPYIEPPDGGTVWSLLVDLDMEPKVKFVFAAVPAARSIALANNGVLDGDIIRSGAAGVTHTNLIRVDVAVCIIEIVAFSWQRDMKVNSFTQMSDIDDIVVSTKIGRKLLQSRLQRYPNRLFVESAEKLFSLLEQKRSDVAILDRGTAYRVIGDRLGRTIFQVSDRPLLAREHYLYLHMKHAALVPEIEKALSERMAQKPLLFERAHP